jgi:hypothetical protein
MDVVVWLPLLETALGARLVIPGTSYYVRAIGVTALERHQDLIAHGRNYRRNRSGGQATSANDLL